MAEAMHDLEMLVLGVELVPKETWSHVPCVLHLRMNSLENLLHLELYYIHQVTFRVSSAWSSTGPTGSCW